MARAARNEDVVISHYVWMSNHPHLEVFSLDAQGFANFHGRTKKRMTEYLKRLLGLSHLRLWGNRSNVAEVLDLEAAIERIVYAYTNPAQAGRGSIDEFEGCNTWKEFQDAPASLDAVIEKEVPWVLLTDIEPLSQPNPSEREEQEVVDTLLEKAEGRTETLRIHPFKWLAAYGITSPEEIEKIRQRIIRRVREEEAKYFAESGPYTPRLEGFDITNRYVPKVKERQIHHIGSTKEIRMQYREHRRRTVDRCRQCYDLMKQGAKNIPWPPDAFVPPAPKLANAL